MFSFCIFTDPWMVELCSKLGKYTVRPHGILRKTNIQRIQASWDRILRVRTFLSDSIDPALQASIRSCVSQFELEIWEG